MSVLRRPSVCCGRRVRARCRAPARGPAAGHAIGHRPGDAPADGTPCDRRGLAEMGRLCAISPPSGTQHPHLSRSAGRCPASDPETVARARCRKQHPCTRNIQFCKALLPGWRQSLSRRARPTRKRHWFQVALWAQTVNAGRLPYRNSPSPNRPSRVRRSFVHASAYASLSKSIVLGRERTMAVAGRRWHRRPLPVVLIGLMSVLGASEASAPSATGEPIHAATEQSPADAVTQNEKALIDREVLGRSSLGNATAAGLTTFTTGRLRGSDHDALRPPSDTTFSYDTTESSAFANVVVSVPGTVLGGQMKLSGFVGHNEVSLDLKSNAFAVLEPNQSGSASNKALIAGGTLLWSHLNTYALATVVGSWGQTTLRDSVDDCGYTVPPHPTGCNHNRYNFDTTGFLGSVAAGYVFDLAGPTGPKLDLRGSVGYIHNSGDPFKNVFGDQQTYTFSTWTGTAAATVFSNMPLADGAYLRPYIQGYVRQEGGYRSTLDGVQSDGTPLGVTHLEQNHLYGGVDAGLTYTQGDTTLGAAIYYEASGDEHTLGGRLGLSQKLDSLAARSKTF